MAKLRSLGYKVKTGIEVCNFQNQAKVREILSHYDFDYVIGSIHFIRGWAYDSSEIKAEWQNHSLKGMVQRLHYNRDVGCSIFVSDSTVFR